MSLSTVAEVAGYRRPLVCQNKAWDGNDLFHQFLDERSSAVYGPSQGNVFDQGASLRMMPANSTTPQLPPPHMVSYQPLVPKPTPMTPSYAGSFAFRAPHRAPHMIMQTTSRAPTSDRKPSGSRFPPVPNPNLTGRDSSEQAVIIALKAVASNPELSDFVQAVQQRLPGLTAYLQAAAQPSGCEPPATPAEPVELEMQQQVSAMRKDTKE